MLRSGVGTIPPRTFPPDSVVARAIANLQTITVAEETAGANEDKLIAKSDELNNVGLNDWALEELAVASSSAGNSPKVNLAIAQVYRSEEDNVRALNVLKKSFPDYSQMKPAEMTREQWDVFYPLSYWDIIVQESRAKSLDPYQVAGLIRQETVFMSRARSSARAYGLMQLLVPTGTLTAKKYGVERAITEESLYEPRLNIQLGTAYLRDQIDKFGRIEYVAAAYNAGPNRAVQWRSTLPAEMDEWAEAVPFKETRGYVQGVVRNRLQYQRLYDANGKFRAEVGTRAVTKQPAAGSSPGAEAEDRQYGSVGLPRKKVKNESWGSLTRDLLGPPGVRRAKRRRCASFESSVVSQAFRLRVIAGGTPRSQQSLESLRADCSNFYRANVSLAQRGTTNRLAIFGSFVLTTEPNAIIWNRRDSSRCNRCRGTCRAEDISRPSHAASSRNGIQGSHSAARRRAAKHGREACQNHRSGGTRISASRGCARKGEGR